MKQLRRILIILHFFIVAMTISHCNESSFVKPLNPILEVYSSFTYTNRNFGFFAPTVNDDFNLELFQYDKNNIFKGIYHPKINNSEIRIRQSTMLWHFAEGNSRAQMDLYARSWGVFCLLKNPKITRIIVVVTKNNIPTMVDFRAGKKITSKFYYKTIIDVP